MKTKPELQDLKVPEYVFLNLHNGEDFSRIPIENLDEFEVKKILENFCLNFILKTGYNSTIDIEIMDNNK